jgi:putative MATE family efflux protein
MSWRRWLGHDGDASRTATNRILRGALAYEIARFGAPIAVAMGLQTTFNLVDAYLIARLEAAVAGPSLGAIGICDQIAALGTIVSYGVSVATAAMIAQRQGGGDDTGVKRVAWQSLIVVAGLSIVFGALGLTLAGPLIRDVVGAKGAVADLAVQYLRVIVGGSFSIFFLLQLTTIQRALGSSKTPVTMLVSANVLNLVLAVLLVYGPGDAPPVFFWGPPVAKLLHLPRMEVVGAAWATVLARAVVLVPLLVVVELRYRLFTARIRRGFDAALVRRIAGIAWPASCQFVVRILAMLLTQTLVARAFTTSMDQRASTALGVVFRLETLALFLAMGWGSAAQTFLAQNHGAGLRDRALRSGWIAAAYNGLMMVLLAAVYLARGRPIIAFFTNDPAVVDMATGYLHTLAPSYLALGTGIVLGNAITGAGATRLTLVMDLAVVLCVQLPTSLWALQGNGAGMQRLWWVLVATNVVFALVYAWVFRWGRFLGGEVRLAGRDGS